MRKPDIDPVEIVAVGAPIIAEVVAVVLFLAAAFVWISIGATRHQTDIADLGVVHLVGERQ